MPLGTVPDPGSLLAAARDGDHDAFETLIGRHRSELLAHCYRMLGSVHDAEDVLQESMLRAWRGLAGFEGRSSLRAWLYRIVTNVSLNAIASRSRRVLRIDGTTGDASALGRPLAESVWIEPYPDSELSLDASPTEPEARYEQRESLELAFVAALQYLPANQRAALILRDVLGFSARDAAEAMATTTTSVNSALQHARASVEARIPERSQQTTLRALGDDRLRGLVERYMSAFEDADVEALVSLLAEDATWSMPPIPDRYEGHEAISAFMVAGPFTERWRHLPTRANGQLAVGCYAWDEATGSYAGRVLDVLTLDGELITAVTAFIDDTVFARFDLPPHLPA